jgi:hypothetical protein
MISRHFLLAACWTAAIAPYAASQGPGTPPQYLQDIVVAHAPIILQETVPPAMVTGNIAANDHLLRADFDLDLYGRGNKSNAMNQIFNRPKPAVYYSITETTDAYYIGYYFYHAYDAVGNHENDLEWYWVMVWKDAIHPYGIATVSLTAAHGAMLNSYNFLWNSTVSGGIDGPSTYNDNNTGPYWTRFKVLHWFDSYSWLMRPVIMIRSESHGTYPAPSITQDPDWSQTYSSGYGIHRQDLGANPGNFNTVIHPNHGVIGYFPWLYTCSPWEGCSGVSQVPVNQSSGSYWYDLLSFIDSPLWTTRTTDGFMYHDAMMGFRGGESGRQFFAAVDEPHGAQPPWAAAGGNSGCKDDIIIGLWFCWRDFARDATTGGEVYSVNPITKTLGAGALLDAPHAVVDSIWRMQMSPTYIHNYYRLGYTPPSIPLPLNVSISGQTVFYNWDTQGSWTANVSGGRPPFTYSWVSSEGHTGTGPSISFGVFTGQTLFLDVYDDAGQHWAGQIYITWCGQTCNPPPGDGGEECPEEPCDWTSKRPAKLPIVTPKPSPSMGSVIDRTRRIGIPRQ